MQHAKTSCVNNQDVTSHSNYLGFYGCCQVTTDEGYFLKYCDSIVKILNSDNDFDA